MLNRLFPHPIMTILLTAVWCLLVNEPKLGTLVFGLILGTVIPFATAAYWPNRPRIPRPHLMLGYIAIVVWDIIVANVVVAAIVLFKRNDRMQPNWVSIPLDLRTPEAITMLAGTITLTPGTVSADISDQGHALLVHALDARDPDAVRDEIKQRYERRLKEIFE
ncbi:multisubunit potassium/proton antiporter, PhaE subunit [Pseudooceanicola nitratireducens]|jgi:multicomponent K+:H+ antiporter subunit E|uniref:Multisubunit potassium/proton antiporter, PhaE subunit n=1 Tax=Pseudooceanicola nitratireducens TaxID=517719 RepID=A0A1I1Q6V7_9RHOB|nr:Na+/H+ antiporter subunit E [Pseudooceanicola nitratireducens]SEJ72362.1 multicomponent K+:H+ antiporter subunit E [Pseudooceanicola nitratireducens]SFD17737.1 multisubunit potassium/proton antiporter, PhaE subunit [Pseudooceanicola nitratireducens]